MPVSRTFWPPGLSRRAQSLAAFGCGFLNSPVNARAGSQWLVVAPLIVAAVLLRVGVRLAFGEQYFWNNSYSVYYALAENVISGEGFCFETKCAWLSPLYPLFLAISAAA